MLINNWYVAANSEEVAQEPYHSRMLGLDFVLFRDTLNTVHCLSDVCCHRGGALHRGAVKESCISCPYHGWEFDSKGQCKRIPSMNREFRIPNRAKIDSYPVKEYLGLIWVFLGSQLEDERPEIPDWFENYIDNPDWRVVNYTYQWSETNWERLCENSIDTAHLPFVHKRFGNRISPQVDSVPIEETEFGAKVTRVKAAPDFSQKKGSIAKILPKNRKTTRVSLEWSIIGLAEMLYQEMTTEMTQIIFDIRTPVDQNSVVSHGFQARNFLLEPEHDNDRLELLYEAIKEDNDILRFLKPELNVDSNSREMLIESDKMESIFRDNIRVWKDLGNYIDSEMFEKRSLREVLVIPSPERSKDNSGWIHSTVPIL